MSQLTVASITQSFALNVTAFSSPVYEETSSAQTKMVEVHFPIKMSQPGLQFDVVFSSELEFENFQRFIRNHQVAAATNSQLLTFNWPVRNITNWTGVVKHFQAGGMRFNPLPHARLEVDLIDSLVSARTEMASTAANWIAIYGGIDMPDGVLNEPSLTPQQALTQFGQVFVNGGFYGSAQTINANPNETSTNPIGLPSYVAPVGNSIIAGGVLA